MPNKTGPFLASFQPRRPGRRTPSGSRPTGSISKVTDAQKHVLYIPAYTSHEQSLTLIAKIFLHTFSCASVSSAAARTHACLPSLPERRTSRLYRCGTGIGTQAGSRLQVRIPGASSGPSESCGPNHCDFLSAARPGDRLHDLDGYRRDVHWHGSSRLGPRCPASSPGLISSPKKSPSPTRSPVLGSLFKLVQLQFSYRQLGSAVLPGSEESRLP